MNENEARIIAHELSAGKLQRSYDHKDLIRVSRALHETLNVTVDVHTPIGCTSSTGSDEAWIRSFGRAEGLVTGAGDIWDAGDIVGHILKFKTEDRLTFANACAHLYVSSKTGDAPSIGSVLRFLRKQGAAPKL
jgi:sugar/nucleoside kinase (ribokinase family)